MRVAALDLGSNTSILLIADVEDGEITRVRRDEVTVTRMGQGVHANRRFDPSALARVGAALARYQKIIAGERCDRVMAVATSAARDVENGEDLLAIGRHFDVPIHIIPGEREAELTFRGAVGGLGPLDRPVVVDVGGGSTEIIGDGGAVSVDVGSVRLHEMFVTADPPTATDAVNLREYARAAFAKAAPPIARGDLVAVSGTPTALATLDQGRAFVEADVHGYRLSRARVAEWSERLRALPLVERERLAGMPPGRADVLTVGAAILLAAMDALDRDQVIVSTRGVRFGLARAWAEFAP